MPQVLCGNGVIPEEQPEKLWNMASFRNMLVLHYDKIDDEVVFGIFIKRPLDSRPTDRGNDDVGGQQG